MESVSLGLAEAVVPCESLMGVVVAVKDFPVLPLLVPIDGRVVDILYPYWSVIDTCRVRDRPGIDRSSYRREGEGLRDCLWLTVAEPRMSEGVISELYLPELLYIRWDWLIESGVVRSLE